MRCVILFVSKRGWKLVEPLLSVGVHPVATIICDGGKSGYLRAFVCLLISLIKTKKDTIVLTDSSRYIGIMAYVGSLLFCRELVYRARGDSLAEHAERGELFHAWFYRYLMLPKFKKIISVSSYLKNELVQQGVPESKIYVMPTPQSLSEMPPVIMEQRVRRVLVVTSFKFRGKCEVLHKILPELDHLLSKNIEFSLAIAGGGPYLNDFSLAVAKCRNPERFNLLGFVNGLTDLYRSSFALLHVSDLDAYPSVINEARSFGTPVIAGNNGGMSEQIHDGEDGILLHAPSALDEAFARLQRPEVWHRLSENGRSRVMRDHSLECIGRQLKNHLELMS